MQFLHSKPEVYLAVCRLARIAMESQMPGHVAEIWTIQPNLDDSIRTLARFTVDMSNATNLDPHLLAALYKPGNPV